MNRATNAKTITALAFTLACSFLAVSGSNTANAQSTKWRLTPVKIDGFQYRYIAKAKLHMNICKSPQCGRGSKVSYIFLKNNTNPNFKTYVKNRKQIANILRQRAPNGSTLEFAKPKVRKNTFATVFSQLRKATNANGQVLYTMSTSIHTPIKTISLISSSRTYEHVKANRSKFGVALTKMIRTTLGLPIKN